MERIVLTVQLSPSFSFFPSFLYPLFFEDLLAYGQKSFKDPI